MIRTNIYLEESQSKALGREARALGVSRAELVRRFIDRGLDRSEGGDLAVDLAAIRDSFGALAQDGESLERTGGDRERHLDRIWRL